MQLIHQNILDSFRSEVSSLRVYGMMLLYCYWLYSPVQISSFQGIKLSNIRFVLEQEWYFLPRVFLAKVLSATGTWNIDHCFDVKFPYGNPLFNVKSEPESAGPSSEFDKIHISPVLISDTFRKRTIPRTPIPFLLTSTLLTLQKIGYG
jgi:hypothetical protein